MAESSMRLDKWLKVARIFKQRTKASAAIEGGLVKVNDERVKPAKLIKPGDELLVKKGHIYRKLTVKGISTRSVSVKLARELYELHEKELPDTEMAEFYDIWDEQERQNRIERKKAGKPNKKLRREINKHKYEPNY